MPSTPIVPLKRISPSCLLSSQNSRKYHGNRDVLAEVDGEGVLRYNNENILSEKEELI